MRPRPSERARALRLIRLIGGYSPSEWAAYLGITLSVDALEAMERDDPTPPLWVVNLALAALNCELTTGWSRDMWNAGAAHNRPGWSSS